MRVFVHAHVAVGSHYNTIQYNTTVHNSITATRVSSPHDQAMGCLLWRLWWKNQGERKMYYIWSIFKGIRHWFHRDGLLHSVQQAEREKWLHCKNIVYIHKKSSIPRSWKKNSFFSITQHAFGTSQKGSHLFTSRSSGEAWVVSRCGFVAHSALLPWANASVVGANVMCSPFTITATRRYRNKPYTAVFTVVV